MVYAFHDFHPGRVFVSEWLKVTKEEIIDFAHKFDPQPFHTGINQRRFSLFDSIIASGWHTCALCQKLIVKNYLYNSTCLASSGVDYVRFSAPLLPGDQIRAISKVLNARDSDSRPKVGIVKFEICVSTLKEKEVLQMAVNVLFAK